MRAGTCGATARRSLPRLHPSLTSIYPAAHPRCAVPVRQLPVVPEVCQPGTYNLLLLALRTSLALWLTVACDSR